MINQADHFDQEHLARIGKRPFALWIGVIELHKDPLKMIEIARAIPEMDFVMLGAPSNRSVVGQLMTEKPPNLYYVGPLSDQSKIDLIQRSSVGLTTSKNEGFGWVPFEFLTAGKPVLANRLSVFEEIYGDLLVYAHDVAGFVKQLRKLYDEDFKTNIDREAMQRFLTKYDFAKAASGLVKRFNVTSLTVFTRDLPVGSDAVFGLHLVNWKLLKSLVDSGVDVRIFSYGKKFCTMFGLTDRTREVGRFLLPLRRNMYLLERSTRSLDKVKRKILNLALLSLEPFSFLFSYIRNRSEAPSRFVIATDVSQVFAAIMLKCILRLRVACLIHDMIFAMPIWKGRSVVMKIYFLVFTHSLGYLDYISVVSKATLRELSLLCPRCNNVEVLWKDSG
jgi:hypothetical protein